MTEDDFKLLLAVVMKTLVEFKGPGKRSDKPFLAKVVRAVLGMANRRNGGLVIIGVEEKDEALYATGLSEDQLTTWRNFDIILEAINHYATPSVTLEREFLDYQGGNIVVLRVSEFDDVPLLCRDNYNDPDAKKSAPILRRGACYVRSRHKRETSEIPSEEEMRELLDIAIVKGVRKFLERAKWVGLYPSDRPTDPENLDEEDFENQRKDFR